MDVAICGGGPSGLAAGIALARVGLRCVVLERQRGPVDKACGEGLMPAGVDALEWLGVRALLDPADCCPLEGLRYVQEDGTAVEGGMPRHPGLGVRRLALAAAFAKAASRAGVEVRERCRVEGYALEPGAIRVRTSEGVLSAGLLVAADGLHSPLRKAAGLERRPRGLVRFGARRHYALAPWTRFVEIHLGDGAEAYVTPVGPGQVGVALLWWKDRGGSSYDGLLARFPRLLERLAGAPASSAVRGAGPLSQRAASQTAERLVLMGDAAGYVDAVTGEGLTLAFQCARALAEVAPGALERGATRAALAGYQRAFDAAYRRYAITTRAVLALVRRPGLRRRAIQFLAEHPKAFDAVVAAAVP